MFFDVESISDVRGARIEVADSYKFESIELGRSIVNFIEPVKFVGSITNAGDCMLVKGDITTRAKAVCDICLCEFEYDITIPFEQSYSTLDTRASSLMFNKNEDEELEQDEVIVYSDKEIDISCEVEQALIISIPFRIECKENCKGLCIDCGANLNFENCKCK